MLATWNKASICNKLAHSDPSMWLLEGFSYLKMRNIRRHKFNTPRIFMVKLCIKCWNCYTWLLRRRCECHKEQSAFFFHLLQKVFLHSSEPLKLSSRLVFKVKESHILWEHYAFWTKQSYFTYNWQTSA